MVEKNKINYNIINQINVSPVVEKHLGLKFPFKLAVFFGTYPEQRGILIKLKTANIMF